MQPELMKWIFIILKAQLYKYVLFGFISLVLILVFLISVFLSISSLQSIHKDCCQTWNFCSVYLNLMPKKEIKLDIAAWTPITRACAQVTSVAPKDLSYGESIWDLVSSPTLVFIGWQFDSDSISLFVLKWL